TALWESRYLHRQHTLSRLFVSKLFRPFRACKKSFAPYKGLRPLLLIPPLRGSCLNALQALLFKPISPFQGL
ncbi:MAG TPA: hypothetical protein PK502_08800, partial [Tenuifilaceae bacterium]|nr:hypothetical protein [Tenuifilaceae bacterium]